MSLEEKFKRTGIDPLAEATRGAYHWNDPGMDELEMGFEEFFPGQRVEVLTQKGWLSGTIREVPGRFNFKDLDARGITVECDEQWNDSPEYEGRGAFIQTYCNTKRNILSLIRGIPTSIEDLRGN